MDVKPLGISPKELDMVESRKFLRDECLQHYQIPPEAFGIIENSNRATIDSSLYLAQKNVFVPRLRFFERVLNNQLLNEYDDLICRHDIKIIEDDELKLRIYQFGVQNGCITKEQYCEQFGINPKPEEGHYIVPIGQTIIPAGEEFDLSTIPLPEEDKPEEEPPKDEDKKKALSGSAGRVISQKKERDEWRAKIWDNFDTKARNNEPMFISAIKKIAKKQSGDILSKIKDLEEINDATINNLCNDYFQKECNEAVKRGLAKCWLSAMESGRENAKIALEGKKEITVISDVTITNDMFNKWVEKYGLAKSTELNQTTKRELLKKLRKTLAEGVDSSMPNLKKELQKSAEEVFSELSNTRAFLIARTETGASVNVGQVSTYKATGIEKKEWISTLDDRTRESHLQMDGVIADIDSTFEVENLTDGGVDNMLYPLDPTGSAGNVCNCRCTVAPVVF
jgi:SPP1 gp7 family putative phage head morphogenesis protein